MPADEVARGTDVDESRVRTGPRHAAPRKPLFTRFHVPAGKAIALAAMPTAVLMGMGFTPTLALADDHPASKSLSVDEYKDCVTALEDATASPSASASDDASSSATPSPSASASDDASKDTSKDSPSKSGDSSGSSDSGSDSATAEPEPSASASADTSKDSSSKSADSSGSSAATPSASASPSASSGNVLKDLGDAITDLFTGGKSTATDSATPTPTASASASADAGTDSSSDSGKDTAGDAAGDAAKDGVAAATKAAGDAVKDTTDTATKAAEDAAKAAEDAAESATPTPSASASATTDPDDCPAATDAESGIDNKVTLPDDPWYLNASSLLLTGADYQGVVEVKTADGSVKKVLKYVVSDGTDIGDLKQTVRDKQQDKTYHVEGAKGSTSTIRDGDTTMYTESISGNLFGLIPVTFDVDNPPPLNIPLIYFTNVTVVQAGQFGGTLHIPGLSQYVTDGSAG